MAGPVFVGIATLDVVQYEAAPIRPGHKTTSGRSWVGAGGHATNAAICCAHLTGAATLVSAVGSGTAAGLVRDELAARGVTLIDCAPPGFELPAAAIVVTPDGERTVVSPGATSSPVTAIPEALAAMTTAGVILVDGHHPGLGEAVRAAMPPRDNSRRPLVVADAGSVKPVVEDWLTDWIDVLAGSQDYAAGLGVSAAGACEHALRHGAGAAVVTAGADPVHWAGAAGRRGTHTPPTVRARDTLGAGDAFHGALVAALTSTGLSSAGTTSSPTPPGERGGAATPAGGGTGQRAADWMDRIPDAVARASRVAATAVADPTARGWLTPELSAWWRA